MNIEDFLNPEGNKLITDSNYNVKAYLLDAELDMIRCDFFDTKTVRIDTNDLHYIDLTLDNLGTLIRLIIEADDFYNNLEL